MSSESKGNEIDDLFKNTIEPVNTEPSAQFWQNAAQDVISRGSKLNDKNSSRWRVIAFILGTGLLILGYFFYKMGSRLSTVEQQMATIKNIQPKGIKKENPIISGNTNLNKTTGEPVAASNNNSAPSKKNQSIFSAGTTNVKRTKHSAQTGPISHINYSSSFPTAAVFDIQSHRDKQDNKPVEVTAYNTNDKVASNSEEKQVNNPTEQDNSTNTANTSESLPSAQKLTQATPAIIPPSQPYVLTQASIVKSDSLKAIQLAADTNFSRLSVSAFFSPNFMMGYQFKTSGSWGSRLENTIKTGEKQNFSYTAGVKGTYDLSPRLSISTGIAYQVFSFNIAPNVIYAQKLSDGDVGYYLTTSSGVVDCPYYGKTAIGDSLKMNASSTRSYLEIPLAIKYNFINKEKYKFYLNVGLEANICLAEKTTMDWQDFWNKDGIAIVNGTEGSESMYMTSYIGIGTSYKIGKYLSLYLEPGLHEAITSLDNNTSAVITYPRLFSITTGLTYHIK